MFKLKVVTSGEPVPRVWILVGLGVPVQHRFRMRHTHTGIQHPPCPDELVWPDGTGSAAL